MAKKKKSKVSGKRKRSKSVGKRGKKFLENLDVRIVIGIVVLTILVIGYLISGGLNKEKKLTIKEDIIPVVSEIVVHDQQIVNSGIVIDSYSLEKPGFLVVHLAVGDLRGVIVGQSSLIRGRGTLFPVRINGNQRGREVFVVFYYDNGDNRFNVVDDEIDESVARKIKLR